MVNILCVNDLKNYPYGSTHREAKAIATGTLTVVTTETHSYPRGTVLLLERTSKSVIPCLVNRLHTHAVNTKVFIKKWNLVNLQEGANSCHLEFRLEYVYTDEECKKSILKEALRADAFPFNQSLRREHQYYTPGDQLHSSKNVCMAGIVYAVSTLYVQPGEPVMFFVQMTSSNIQTADTGAELTAINVLFRDNKWIEYYRYFQIGGAFAFQNLEVDTIHSTDRHSFNVLTFGPRTNVQSITFSQYESICSNRTDSSSEPPSKKQLTLIHVHKHKAYTGTITRVIDSMFGIYELDHTIIVSLFHLFSYAADMPYRIDTQVRLHHFHAVIVNPEDGKTSYLLQHVWQANKADEGYFALAACMQSHVEVLKFPKNHNVFEEITKPFFLAHNTDLDSQIKSNVYTDIIRRKSTFQQLLRQLEIYAALTVKFVDTQIVKDIHGFQHAYNTVRNQVFATTQTPVMRAGDMINDFVLHDTVCLLVGEGNLRIVIDAYPSLDKIQANLETKLEDHTLDLAGGNTMFEKEYVLTQKADYDQTADYYILGMLQVARDGRLYLIDNESRVLFVLAAPSSNAISARTGEICMVRRLHMFTEDLAFVDNENEELIQRKDLRLTYFVCQHNDLLLLRDTENDNESVTFCLPDLEDAPLTRKLDRLSVPLKPTGGSNYLPTEHRYLAVHVVNRFPVEVCFTTNGTVHLECRVLVKMYQIKGLGSTASPSGPSGIVADGSKNYALVFTSLKNSLQWHLDFQVGSYWVIYGLDAPESFIESITNISPFALTIDADNHTIYPIVPSTDSTNKIQLTPHYSQNTIGQDPQSVVYNVSQLTDTHLPPGITTATIPQHFAEQLVHVQGVVIIKRFMEGFSSHGTLNKHAFKLYSQLGISTGKTNRKLFVQLRQPDSLQVISIYMDVHKTHYPVGLVIGATVTFRNLIRKKKAYSNEEFFFLANSATCIHINDTTPSPSVVSMEPALIHTRLISSFLDTVIGRPKEGDRQIFRLFCYIHSIINLTLKWECRDCGSIVRNNDCYGMCQGASRVFSVHAFVLVSDGTGNATASIDGERLVFRLLQLSSNQIDALKNLVLNYGQLAYGGLGGGKVTTMDDEEERMSYDPENDQRSAMHGYTLEDLCNNAKRAGQFYLYGQEQSSGKKRVSDEFNEDLIKEFQLRRFKISDNGSLLKTAELSKLRIKVIEITFPDARMVAYEMLDSLNQNNIPPESASASLPTSIEVADFDYTVQLR
ncbi:serine/threonine protein kinase [Mucor velutinosus]|uniref:CST complex subunit CTC1 n=1 Tax=Mucor velutinosus TaxID=708070 RepID=A0AAN7D8Y9_9FUNG|nr:serine/threonine protein kinase [Mucor velutinosus]